MSVKKTVIRDRLVSRLKELELSTHEAMAYVTLLSNPNIAASTLCQETGIADSKIYYALDGLCKKGMAVMQRGNPNIYQPSSPQDAIANLKSQLTEAFHERMREADILVDMLMPMYEESEKSGELEVAYIIRGKTNIIKRMRALIESARKEITVFFEHPEVFRSLRESLLTAKEKRKVGLNIAMTEEVFQKEDLTGLERVRLLRRTVDSLGMIISDMNTLLTVSDWMGGAALLTQDQNLIQVTKEYYENSSCCAPVD
ncbi:MAG: TrmB family transcriptional regulator [Candidatus Thorarchaeota archaeon]